MIEVSITDYRGELARIQIENVEVYEDGTADYSARFVVDRVFAVGIHKRGIFRFPRTKTNVLGLLLAAMNTLTEKEMSLEDGVEAGDLARQERGTLPALPGKAKRRGRNH